MPLLVWISWNDVVAQLAHALLSLATPSWRLLLVVNQRQRSALCLGDWQRQRRVEESISGVRGCRSRELAFRNPATPPIRRQRARCIYTLRWRCRQRGYVAIAIVAGVGGIFMLQADCWAAQTVTLGPSSPGHPDIRAALQPTHRPDRRAVDEHPEQDRRRWNAFELLDEQPEIVEKFDAKPMPSIQGKVVFNNVWAEYKRGEPVLKQIDLTAEPGQTIAIVGPTGGANDVESTCRRASTT